MKPMLVAVTLLSFALTACGGSEQAEQDEDRETVFDPLVETIDRAEAVNDVAVEQKERMDEALREMEGEDEEPR